MTSDGGAEPSRGLPAPDAGDAELAAFLRALGTVDDQHVAARAQRLADVAHGLDPTARAARCATALACTDLTTLEGTDTPERVRTLGATAVRPDPDDEAVGHVAALCIYSDMVAPAVEAVRGSGVLVAAVAGAFPSGRAPLAVRVADVEAAVAAGADEVDVVLDRGALLAGRSADVVVQLRALRAAAGAATLKVILETVELRGATMVRDAAWLALLAGADFVKTSTGKGTAGATLADTLVLLEAARDHERAAGRPAGVKASGGIRAADTALGYLALVEAAVGPDWLVPARFRFGASGLVGALVAARRAAQA